REIPDSGVGAHARLAEDAVAGGPADPVNVREGDFDALLARKIHACNTGQDQPCRCLCLGLRLQMMRVTPCRLTTLQCSQIGFTLERTFTSLSGPGYGLAAQYTLSRKAMQGREFGGSGSFSL